MNGRQKNNNIIIWLAVIISLAALWLGWTAYNRTGNNIQEELRLDIARAEARAELSLVRVEIAEEDYAQASLEAQEIQVDLEEVYRETAVAPSSEWERINKSLNNLIEKIQTEEATEAQAAITSTIEVMQGK